MEDKKIGPEELDKWPDQEPKKKSLQTLRNVNAQVLSKFLQSKNYEWMGEGGDFREAFFSFMEEEFIPKELWIQTIQSFAELLGKSSDAPLVKEDWEYIAFDPRASTYWLRSEQSKFVSSKIQAASTASLFQDMQTDVLDVISDNPDADFKRYMIKEGISDLPWPLNVNALEDFFHNNTSFGYERYTQYVTEWIWKRISNRFKNNSWKVKELLSHIDSSLSRHPFLKNNLEALDIPITDQTFKDLHKWIIRTTGWVVSLDKSLGEVHGDILRMLTLTIHQAKKEVFDHLEVVQDIQPSMLWGKWLRQPHTMKLDKSKFSFQYIQKNIGKDISQNEIDKEYERFINTESNSFVNGMTQEERQRHIQMVWIQEWNNWKEENEGLQRYISTLIAKSSQTLIEHGKWYGADMDLYGGESEYLTMLTALFDPKIKEVEVPWWVLHFHEKKIRLISPDDDTSDSDLWKPELTIDLEKSVIPQYMREILWMPYLDAKKNPLWIVKQPNEKWLLKRTVDGIAEWFGKNNGVLWWYDSEETLEPIELWFASSKNEDWVQYFEYQLERPDDTYKYFSLEDVKWMTFLRKWENQLLTISEKVIFDKRYGNISGGWWLNMLQVINLQKAKVTLVEHESVALELLRSRKSYENATSKKKLAMESRELTKVRSNYPPWIKAQYDWSIMFSNIFNKDTGEDRSKEQSEKYDTYWKTRFVDLTNENVPTEFTDFHSDTDPIPWWIEGDGQMVANTQYFNSFLTKQFDTPESQTLFVDWKKWVIILIDSTLSEKDQELFEELFNTSWKDSEGKSIKIHKNFPDFTTKWIRTLRNQFEKEKSENPSRLTDELIKFLEDRLSAYEKTLERFEQRKNHESMHRFFMTQSKHQEKIGKSYSGSLDEEWYKEILNLWLEDVDENSVTVTHELLCVMAEWRNTKRILKDEKLTENEIKNAKRCAWYVVLQSDLSTGWVVVLYDVEIDNEVTIKTSELNTKLHKFFWWNIAYKQSWEVKYRSFDWKDLWSNISSGKEFDLSKVRQYSMHQAMRSDNIEIAAAANTQWIATDRITNISGSVDLWELQSNTSTTYAQPSTVTNAASLRGQANAIVFPVADRGWNVYTGESLDDEARRGIRDAAQDLWRAARASDGEIAISQDESGRYVLDPALPEDLKDAVDKEIRSAFGSKTVNAETSSNSLSPSWTPGNTEGDENNEQPESFEDKFGKTFYGDKLAKPENGTVIMARRQGSKLQWWWSIRWRWEIIDASPGCFSIRFDSTTEIWIESEIYGPIEWVEWLEKLSSKLKELYKFNPIWSYTDIASVSSGFDEQDWSKKISDWLSKFDGLQVSGNTFTKDFYDSADNNKKSTETVEYRWNLEARDGWDNVLFKVEPYWNKVRVTSEPTDAKGQFGMEHVMDIPTFVMFMADKGFEPYCKQEIERESVKYPNRWDQSDETQAKGFWDGFVSISAALAAIKKFPEAFKYRQEQQEKFEASLFAKQISGVIPDSMSFLYANEIKNDLISEHDDTTFSVINGYKDKISQKDGAWGTHDKVIAKIIESEVFKNPETGIRFKHKAAWYLLYAMEKWNPYIRSLAKYSDQWMWTRVLLGEAKQKQFLRERKELYARLKTKGASDDEYDKLAKLEIKFIFEHLTDHPLFGPKYGRTLEDLHDNYSLGDKVDAVKWWVSWKWNFLDMYNAFNGGWMKGFKPSTMMWALEAMEETAEEPIHYNIFYKALMQMLLSWIVSFEFDNKMKDRLRGICRKRGIPIWMMCKQIWHPETIMTIVNYIAKKSWKSEMSSELQDMIRSLSPSSFASEVNDDWKMKPKYNVISWQVAKRRESSQNWATVMDAFNYKNSSLLEWYAEKVPEIESYFGTWAVFNPVKDYREDAATDGNSPFYNWILNLAPGTFQSQMLISWSWKTFDKKSRTSQELRKKFNGGLDTFENLIDWAKPGDETEAYITFIRKKFKSYFWDKMQEENLWFMKKAIDTWNRSYFERLLDQKLLNDEFTQSWGSSGSRLTWEELEFGWVRHKKWISEEIYRKWVGTYSRLLWKAFAKLPWDKKSLMFSKEPYA